MRTHTGRLTLDAARSAQPDVIILDEALPSADTHALCRALRDDAEVGPSTPILVTIGRRPSSGDHMAALRAGVWEFLLEPLPAEELTARVASYVAGRAERGGGAPPVDEATGLVSLHGLTQRARELTLQAFHHYAPLACVALAPAPGSVAEAAELLAETLQTSGRRSDAIGTLGPGEFLVVAPGANGSGAVRLAERFARLLQATATRRGSSHAPRLRAGYDAVTNVHYAPTEPRDLMGHAASALRERGVGTSESWIRRYGEG